MSTVVVSPSKINDPLIPNETATSTTVYPPVQTTSCSNPQIFAYGTKPKNTKNPSGIM